LGACSSTTASAADATHDASDTPLIEVGNPLTTTDSTASFAADTPPSHPVDTNVPAIDASTPACSVSATELTGGAFNAAVTPAFGTFTSPDVVGAMCSGADFAYVETTEGSTYLPSQVLFLLNENTDAGSDAYQFTLPATAIAGDFSVMAGLGTPSVGVYDSASSCGLVSLCATLPIPAGVDCEAGAPTGSSCPAGCAMEGPILGPSCQAINPTVCYAANGTSDCAGNATSPLGSFQIVLTSVALVGDAGGTMPMYEVHGEFTGTLVEDNDAGGTMSVDIHF
jgi:hypothetical protein